MFARSIGIGLVLCFGGLLTAPAAAISLATKASVQAAPAGDLATEVKAQVLAARKGAADQKAANLAGEKVVRDVFAKLNPNDTAKAAAILKAIYGIPGIDFVRMVTAAAEGQPLMSRYIARYTRQLAPSQSNAILTALASSAILNKALGTGPGSTSVSANVAVLTGNVQSNEQ